MMGKVIYSIVTAALGLFAPEAAAMNYFSCDFEDGMPGDFSLYDEDAGALHFTMVQLGFGDADSWTVIREGGTENHYAASASRFRKDSPVSKADDWMVTPPVWIRASDATLKWRGMSVNERNSSTSSYRVFISEDGGDPGSFTSAPVAAVDDESPGSWTDHSVDLSAYVGKRVRIAFVNVSEGSDVLAIDDIAVVGSAGLANLQVHPGEFTLGQEEISFGGIVTATSPEMVNTLKINFHVDDSTFTAEYFNLGLSEGESYEFQIPEKVAAAYGETVPFTVEAEVNGVRYDDMQLSTTLLAFLPEKRVVVEEATGMWCGYCPEGIVAMETMQERYPDKFIGIAVHVDDKMTVEGYGNVMSFPSGAPTAWIDRADYCESLLTPVTVEGKHTYTTLRGGLESMYLDRMARQALADVDILVAENGEEQGRGVDVSVKSRFAVKFDDRDFRIALVMTEDNVWEPGYYQTNYHSGRDELLGGFESLPPKIVSDFSFNHVARAFYDDWRGIEGSLPASPDPGVEYTYETRWKVPENVSFSNARVVAMIVDASTGEIMNANRCEIGNLSVDAADAGKAISISVREGVVTAACEGDFSMAVYSLDGMRMAEVSGNGFATVGNLLQGIYVVRLSSGEQVKIAKVRIP